MPSRGCITRLINSLARLINGWGRAAGAPQALSWRVKQLINRVIPSSTRLMPSSRGWEGRWVGGKYTPRGGLGGVGGNPDPGHFFTMFQFSAKYSMA